MTEGFEHLIETYRQAGVVASNAPCAWGYTLAQGDQPTNRVTVIHMIMSQPDDHGRVLAQRWGYQDEAGCRILAPSPFPALTKVINFNMIMGAQW